MPVKRNIYIIGASNFGREMESWLELIPENKRDWIFRGFLHAYQGESPLKDYPSDYKIIGEWETFPFTKDDYCIIAVADCKWKEKIYNFLKARVTFFTFIAPNVIIGKFTEIGEGSIICPNCVITTNVKICKCVTINIGTQIGHDVIIGNFSSIMANVDLSGNVTLEEKVFVGTKATVIPKIKIGNNATIGAGSVVIRNIRQETVVFGNPAHIV